MPNYIALLDYAINVPPLIWSGVIGAFIALFGVFVANWQNANRQRDQHKFDSAEKRRDRSMTLRKEVYLPLAAALQEVQRFLETLPFADEGDQDPITKFSVEAAKLSVVAETATTILANTLSSELMKAYFDLSNEARPARDAKESQTASKEFRIEAQKNEDGIQKEIDRFLQSTTVDNAKFMVLTGQKKMYQKLAIEFGTSENAAMKLHALHTTNFFRLLLKKIPYLTDLSFDLLISVRRDFEIETNESVYRAALVANRDSVLKTMENMVDVNERWRIAHADKVVSAS